MAENNDNRCDSSSEDRDDDSDNDGPNEYTDTISHRNKKKQQFKCLTCKKKFFHLDQHYDNHVDSEEKCFNCKYSFYYYEDEQQVKHKYHDYSRCGNKNT